LKRLARYTFFFITSLVILSFFLEVGIAQGDAQRSASNEEEVDVDPRRSKGVLNKVNIRMPQSDRLRFEWGIFPQYRSNLFQSTGGAPKTSAVMTTISGKAEWDFLQSEASKLTGSFLFERNVFRGVENAESSNLDIGLNYQFGRNDLQVTYFNTPRRLAFISQNEGVFNSVEGVDLGFVARPSRSLRARVGYVFSRLEHEDLSERNSSYHEFVGDLRLDKWSLLRPGLGLEIDQIRADSINFDRWEYAPVVFLGSRLGYRAWLNLRYRFRTRNYSSEVPGLSNFGRVDHRHDIRFYANIKLSEHWWLFLYQSFIDGRSTRQSRDFRSFDIGLGIYHRFGFRP
jgi:hypothetical protein